MTQKLSRRKKASDLLDELPPPPDPGEAIEVIDDPREAPAQRQAEAPVYVDVNPPPRQAPRPAQNDRYEIGDDDTSDEVETVESLREQLARERDEKRRLQEGKSAAENVATSYRREADGKAAEALHAARAAIDNGLHLTQANITAAQRAIAESAAAGDWALFTAAQTNLAENIAKLTELNGAKAEVEHRAKNPEPRQPIGDPVEAEIAQFTPQSQAWLQRNRDAVFKDNKTRVLTRKGHEMAVEGMGLIPDSPEYFAFMDDHINRTIRGGAPAPAANPSPPPVQRQAARVPAAPVAPASFGQAPSRKGQVALTAAEKQTAIELRPDLSPQQALLVYAQGKKAINEGQNTNLMWSRDKYQGGRT
jgi:hypothetical protein